MKTNFLYKSHFDDLITVVLISIQFCVLKKIHSTLLEVPSMQSFLNKKVI